MRFRVSGFRSLISGFGFRVSGFGFGSAGKEREAGVEASHRDHLQEHVHQQIPAPPIFKCPKNIFKILRGTIYNRTSTRSYKRPEKI